jgi:hypothetical protein
MVHCDAILGIVSRVCTRVPSQGCRIGGVAEDVFIACLILVMFLESRVIEYSNFCKFYLYHLFVFLVIISNRFPFCIFCHMQRFEWSEIDFVLDGGQGEHCSSQQKSVVPTSRFLFGHISTTVETNFKLFTGIQEVDRVLQQEIAKKNNGVSVCAGSPGLLSNTLTPHSYLFFLTNNLFYRTLKSH